MPHEHIGVDERRQRRRPARSRRVRCNTSSHGVPRLLAGTDTLPAGIVTCAFGVSFARTSTPTLLTRTQQ
jgi:hypothetical protein